MSTEIISERSQWTSILREPRFWKVEEFFDFRGSLEPIKFPEGFSAVQSNLVRTFQGMVRGLHWQKSPYQQAKLIVLIAGRIRDVIVNMDTGEKHSFDMHPGEALFVPHNFAHGFCALEDSIVMYMVDDDYRPSEESGCNPFCSELAIDWGYASPKSNERDAKRPSWSKREA